MQNLSVGPHWSAAVSLSHLKCERSESSKRSFELFGGGELGGKHACLFPRPRAHRQWDFKRLSAVVSVCACPPSLWRVCGQYSQFSL